MLGQVGSQPGDFRVFLFFHLAVAVALVAVLVYAGRLRSGRQYTDLFFMGAAFLLLETKNVVQFALLFGTTWFVNALVFTGILLAVLAAVTVAQHMRLKTLWPLYGLLLAAVAIAWLVPPESLLGLSLLPRFLAATALAFIPIFFANLVFAQRFKAVGSSKSRPSSSTTSSRRRIRSAVIAGSPPFGW